VLFVGLVVVHELGHFIAARRNGVEVEEFGIGFPPRAKVLTKKRGTIFTLNWLPLGGFVKLKGEHDADVAPGTFGAASLWSKTKIMIAGVVMNLFAAFVILTALAWLGVPKLIDNQFTVTRDTKIIRQDVLVGYVEPESPAEKAGIQPRDKLISIGPINGKQQTVTSSQNLPNLTQEFASQLVKLAYERGGQVLSTTLQLRSKVEVEKSKHTNNPKGYMGISPTEYVLQRSTWSAPVVAVGIIGQFTKLTYQGLSSAISNLFRGNTTQATAQVSGPVGIFVILKDGSLLGYQFILMIIAVISLTLAIMNILPIPALDGGRLFVTLVFRLFKKPLSRTAEERIHGTGFALLMLLFVLITIVDVRRFF